MIFGKAFDDILLKRQMSVRRLSERTEIGQSRLEASLTGDGDLADEEFEKIAAELGLPVNALFSNAVLPLSDVPDYRKKTPAPAPMEQGVIRALGYVEKVSLSLASLGIDLSADEELTKYTGLLDKKSAKKLAGKWRKRWGITNEQQLEWANANTVYSDLRSYIERLGVFVLHYSMDTEKVAGLYTKIDGGPHAIVINRSSGSKARRLFTLAHEFCHVLLRASGISNPSIRKNRIEVFCNQFAAYLLAPKELIRQGLDKYNYTPSIDNSTIRLLAQNLGISQQCCLLRLIDMKILPKEDYSRWVGRFVGKIPEEDKKTKSGGGGGDPDPIRDKRTYYGFTFLAKLSKARKEGLLDAIDIYRLAGIKPKYQNALLGG